MVQDLHFTRAMPGVIRIMSLIFLGLSLRLSAEEPSEDVARFVKAVFEEGQAADITDELAPQIQAILREKFNSKNSEDRRRVIQVLLVNQERTSLLEPELKKYFEDGTWAREKVEDISLLLARLDVPKNEQLSFLNSALKLRDSTDLVLKDLAMSLSDSWIGKWGFDHQEVGEKIFEVAEHNLFSAYFVLNEWETEGRERAQYLGQAPSVVEQDPRLLKLMERFLTSGLSIQAEGLALRHLARSSEGVKIALPHMQKYLGDIVYHLNSIEFYGNALSRGDVDLSAIKSMSPHPDSAASFWLLLLGAEGNCDDVIDRFWKASKDSRDLKWIESGILLWGELLRAEFSPLDLCKQSLAKYRDEIESYLKSESLKDRFFGLGLSGFLANPPLSFESALTKVMEEVAINPKALYVPESLVLMRAIGLLNEPSEPMVNYLIDSLNLIESYDFDLEQKPEIAAQALARIASHGGSMAIRITEAVMKLKKAEATALYLKAIEQVRAETEFDDGSSPKTARQPKFLEREFWQPPTQKELERNQGSDLYIQSLFESRLKSAPGSLPSFSTTLQKVDESREADTEQTNFGESRKSDWRSAILSLEYLFKLASAGRAPLKVEEVFESRRQIDQLTCQKDSAQLGQVLSAVDHAYLAELDSNFEIPKSAMQLYSLMFRSLVTKRLLAQGPVTEQERKVLNEDYKKSQSVLNRFLERHADALTGVEGSLFNNYALAVGVLASESPPQSVIDAMNTIVKESKDPISIPYFPTFRSGNHRDSAARSVVFHLALALKDENQERTSEHLAHLSLALTNYVEHLPALTIQAQRPGAHAGPDGLAPYYYYGTIPYLPEALHLLETKAKTPEAKQELTKARNSLVNSLKLLVAEKGEGYKPLALNSQGGVYYSNALLGLAQLGFEGASTGLINSKP